MSCAILYSELPLIQPRLGQKKEVAGSQGYLVNPAALKREKISWNKEKNGMVTNLLCMCLPGFINLHVYAYIIQL